MVDASAYMLGKDMGVVDRQASGLQHVVALHLSMHGSVQRRLCLRQRVKDQESRTKAPLAKGQGSRVKNQVPLAESAVRDVLEWGKFFRGSYLKSARRRRDASIPRLRSKGLRWFCGKMSLYSFRHLEGGPAGIGPQTP